MDYSRKERIEIACEAGIGEQFLYQVLTGRRTASPDRCPAIEKATAGRVSVEALRQDVRWVRVPDPAWPNPAGRPCHDYAGPAQIGAPPSEPQAEAPVALPPPRTQEVINAPAAS